MSTAEHTLPNRNSLPPATWELFSRLSLVGDIAGFTLVGGTALAINEQHRHSEDLDFITSHTRLDRQAIQAIVDELHTQGCTVSLQDNPTQRLEFENDGLDLFDYHRDYVVDGVKLSFFTADTETRCALKTQNSTQYGQISVADTSTLFRTKVLLLTKRVTMRDIFDLHFLLMYKGYTLDALVGILNECHPTYPYETVRSRLLKQSFSITDPGFDALVDKDLPVEQLTKDLARLIEQYEVALTQQLLEDETK
ncbi:nucleotidyl transferase AbiEii/AbiGii toxin family protein [Thiohalophilus thiocyanatoxydans]|uniref:Nucleotidyltransferase AbiEii toxin of type IV toxin-antitoxin system n=1 Tax=Thiohalophilus thiocyanatoxydans TaxID=381308 RepID=A0A4R8IY09_9GAMM|nr:nucleotidyl transferase AbiEii/AbiGii toxin family protein [Thiohalophilus thiocyanatoxydans]TDY02699.1 nucleotidyltransferase AbiEii toxin of type IV toxin-antitoxin system [Thiohalophilus thiocyanatoxydans]